jgi:hypothetical protein
MRLREIIQERRIDEAAPLVAGLSIPAILGFVSAAITAYSVFELYQFINKYQENPEDLSDDDWGNVFIYIALVAVPVFAKLGKPLLMKMMPISMRKYGGSYVKKKILDRLAKDKKASDKKYGPGARQGKSPEDQKVMRAKNIAMIKKANESAKKRLSKVSKTPLYDAIVSGLTAGIFGKLFMDYWSKYDLLNEQYKAVSAGDLSDFEGMDEDAAKKEIVARRDRLVGELSIAVSAVIGPLVVAKKIKLFGALFGYVPKGGKFVKGVLNLAADGVAAVTKIFGIGLAALIQTETGKKLLESQIVQGITGLAGTTVVANYELLLNLAEIAGNAAGVDVSGATDAMKPTIQSPAGSPTSAAASSAASQKQLQIMMDPKNNNIKFIDGKQVTGPDGYVLNNIPNTIVDIRRKARAFGIEDPFNSLKFDPNKQYTNLTL